jgi:hypothetical protein
MTGGAADGATGGGESRWAKYSRPLSFRTQCVIAWVGLTAFAASGVLLWRESGEVPVINAVAAVISVCWAIDIARGWNRTPDR